MKIMFVSLTFILHFARLALPLHNVSGASEVKINVRFSHIYFALRSTCIFCTSLDLHYLCTSLLD